MSKKKRPIGSHPQESYRKWTGSHNTYTKNPVQVLCTSLMEVSLMRDKQSIDLWVQQKVIRSHFSTTFFFYNSIWFYSKSLGYIVSRYLTPKQCQVWVSSPGVGLLSNPVLFGCFLKFCSTFALTCLEDRNNIVDQRVGGLIWCLHFSFDSMHSTFLTKDSSM